MNDDNIIELSSTCSTCGNKITSSGCEDCEIKDDGQEYDDILAIPPPSYADIILEKLTDWVNFVIGKCKYCIYNKYSVVRY